ncbi:ZapG family protein [Marinomonas shanghaiensis]|uniref:ZapG family protein n=1 Tax=Marinomonas shanghaiensis TaxID=2202418 RepID=UPI003A9360A6
MNLEEFNIIVFITGIIIGCVATLALKSFIAKNNRKQTDSSSNIITMKTLQQELDSKQVIIDNFFTDSNQHLSTVEKRLAELRNCLAENAKQLSNVTVESSTTAEQNLSSEFSDSVEPPRDYALKQGKEPGMLSENFGLENRDLDLEPKRTM